MHYTKRGLSHTETNTTDKMYWEKSRTRNAVGRIFTKRLDDLKVKWESKSPYGMWLACYELSKFMGSRCLQLHSIFEHKPIGPIGYIPGFFCLLNYTLLFYTTYYHTITGDFESCLPSYCMFGVTVSVCEHI